MEKEKGEEIVAMSGLSYANITPINHISLGRLHVFTDISLEL